MGIVVSCVIGNRQVVDDDDLEYIAKNTALSKEEVHTQFANFASKYPNGKIALKDFSLMLKSCFPNKNVAKLEKHIFRMCDADGDESIDFKEFMMILYIMGNGSPKENLEQIFKIFDTNNDGTITQDEMQKIVKYLMMLMDQDDNPDHSSNQELASTAFKEMDKDQDGKVTKEEFVDACLSQARISSMLALKLVDLFVTE